MNETTATLLLFEERYPDGANTPTEHREYVCPCGKGKVIHERVPGFGENYAWMECEICDASYKVVTGCGHLWELREK